MGSLSLHPHPPSTCELEGVIPGPAPWHPRSRTRHPYPRGPISFQLLLSPHHPLLSSLKAREIALLPDPKMAFNEEKFMLGDRQSSLFSN